MRSSPSMPMQGFTLIEVIVAATILVLFAAAGLATSSMTLATLQQARLRAEALEGIQQDLERVREATLEFCRTTTGYGPSTETGPCQAVPNSNPVSYYIPNFKTACDRSQPMVEQLGTRFLNYLRGNAAGTETAQTTTWNYTSPSSRTYQMQRIVTVGSSPNATTPFDSVSSGRTLTLSYTATPAGTNISLQLTTLVITPNAVAWCPIQYATS